MICSYGVYQSYNNKTQKDFFLGGQNIHWSTSMFSIVATETSVLTFISIPGISYRGDWTFLQLAIGYLFGRVLVSIFLLPIFFEKGIVSIYEILNKKFSIKIQKLASITFLITRVLADGVRFLATAIILQTITGWSIGGSVLLIGLVTLIYTVTGGLKTVIRIDAFQFIIYLISAFICIYYLLLFINLPFNQIISSLHISDKLKIVDFYGNIFLNPFMFFSAFIGGAMLSFASHGADYMMVQRVLATNNISSAKKAMIGSGFFVIIQFSLFLFIGSLIYIASDCLLIDKDREISYVINDILPIGAKGIVIAGVLSAAMSTLSSSVNALASSTLKDWFPKVKSLKISRLIAMFWTFILIIMAFIFNDSNSSLVIVGLKIASFTYGSLLSFFILSKFNFTIEDRDIFLGYVFGIVVVFYLMHYNISWTFYIAISLFINISIVLFLNNFNLNYIRHFLILLLFFSLFPLLNSKDQKNNYKTEILNFPIKESCKQYSIWDGYDVLVANPDRLDIMNVGLVVNHTSSIININDIDKVIEVSLGSTPIYVKKIFTPEHGLNNKYQAGEKILGDMSYNIPIISLYGKNFKPDISELEGLDALIFDIQDIGSRYYTYVSTLTNIMSSCAEIGLPLYVLDRPNPIGGEAIDGPTLSLDYSSFVGMHPIPVRHGMTIGELAFMINELGWHNGEKIDLKIVAMQGWNRSMHFENTGKKWISPSPNIPNNKTAFIYQGTCLIEGTNLSEGRGTNSPFVFVGSPWLDSKKIIARLNDLNLKGVKFNEVTFIPRFIPGKSISPKYKDKKCYGIEIDIFNRELSSPLLITANIINIVSDLHPDKFKFNQDNFFDKLYGSDELRKFILLDQSLDALFEKWDQDSENFRKMRKDFLIY